MMNYKEFGKKLITSYCNFFRWYCIKNQNENKIITWTQSGEKSHSFNTLWMGDADLHLYITTVKDGWCKSAFLTRLVSTHITLNYAIHGACLRMVLLIDVYRNATSLRFNDVINIENKQLFICVCCSALHLVSVQTWTTLHHDGKR